MNATFYAIPAGGGPRGVYFGADHFGVVPEILEDPRIERTIRDAISAWPGADGDYEERVLPDGLPMPYPAVVPGDVLAVRITLTSEQVEAMSHEIRLDPDNVYVRAAIGSVRCAAHPSAPGRVRDRLLNVAAVVGGMTAETIAHHWYANLGIPKEDARTIVAAALARPCRDRAIADVAELVKAGLGRNWDLDEQQILAALAALAALS